MRVAKITYKFNMTLLWLNAQYRNLMDLDKAQMMGDTSEYISVFYEK